MITDSYRENIEKGNIIGLSFIGYSGSGIAQHIAKTKIASNGVTFTIKHSIDCPGHYYKRGTPLVDVLRNATFSKVLRGVEIDHFPSGARMFTFDEKFPFRDLV